MAGASLLTLIDDIASILDDVAMMTKIAARKTAGVLGDDLAVNAQQVSGVKADRELPVVWAVAKGSFKNKLILVPAALALSAFLPMVITPLLLLGGLFLCFEGAEKVLHYFDKSPKAHQPEEVQQMTDAEMVEFEQTKVKGAIRTDFILSAEIIVIALGTVQGQPFVTQALVVSTIAILMTVGVYGVVAGIVKLDDGGLYLVQNSEEGSLKHKIGDGILWFAPRFMKALTVIGTLAMFLVGGGIIAHSIPALESWLHHFYEGGMPAVWQALAPTLLNGLLGLVAGLVVVAVVHLVQKIRGKH